MSKKQPNGKIVSTDNKVERTRKNKIRRINKHLRNHGTDKSAVSAVERLMRL